MGTSDFSIIEKLGLELPPIGIFYDLFRPEGIEPFPKDTRKSLCEILRYAQETGKPFVFSNENEETCVGKNMVGMSEFPPSALSGQIGEKLGVFNSPRCNARLYYDVRRLPKGTVNYVSFVPYNYLEKAPDVLIFTGTPDKMEPVMRAATYSTGCSYSSKSTPVMGCSWLFAYPFITGEINFVVPAFVHGLHGRELWPSEYVAVAVPYPWIPTVIENLNTMKLELEGHESKEKYYSEFEGILKDLARKSEEEGI